MPLPSRPPPDAPESKRREWIKLMNLSVIGMVFPISLLMGYFAGRYIGGFFDATSLGGMIGALVGLLSGFYNMFKMVAKMPASAPPDSHDDTV